MQPRLDPLDGVLLVDKPTGLTSHDVVDAVRRKFRFKKTGHCGTLDPLATGLLILVLGRATKLSESLMNDDKTYEGAMTLGVRTDSHDAEGEIVETKPVPPLTEANIDAAFAKFRGDIYQTPPMVSAVKHQGRPLYKLARKGQTVEREPRLIHIYELSLLKFAPPRVEFRCACTKGTYVRTLASDIGDALGCGAHLADLRRTKSGKFDINDAHRLDDILNGSFETLRQWVVPIYAVRAT
jgi:tRNA pseudouridine55 synthase